MKCAKCGCDNDTVIDSRVPKHSRFIRRRRRCMNCNHRWSTFEVEFKEDAPLYREMRDIASSITSMNDELLKLSVRAQLALQIYEAKDDKENGNGS